MKITKVTKTYFETEGERVYFFEPLDEELTVSELQELMNENEKFLLGEIQKMKKEQITEPSVIDKKGESIGMHGTVDAIMKIIKEHCLLTVEEVASIIHKGIYEKDISEEFPVRNLHIYAIAKMICDKQKEYVNEIPKM